MTKEKPAKGEVVSIGSGKILADGTFIAANVAVGDIVVYNPHLVGYELEDAQGGLTILISSSAIYGKYVN